MNNKPYNYEKDYFIPEGNPTTCDSEIGFGTTLSLYTWLLGRGR